MPRSRPRPAGLVQVGFSALVSIAALPAATGAGEIPSTAYQRSVRAPSELLDQVALAFLYPQLAPSFDRQVVATATTTSSLTGVSGAGVNFRSTGDYAISFLMQDYPAFTVGTRNIFSRQPQDRFPLMQIAGGTRAGPTRLGLAWRAGYQRELDEQIDEDASGTEIVRRQETFDGRTKYFEIALGAGIGGSERSLDLVGEVFRELTTQHVEDVDTRFSDSASGDLENVSRTNWRLAGRAAVPAGSLGRIRLAGSYRDQTSRYRVAVRQGGSEPRRGGGGYGHHWTAATSYEHSFTKLGLVRVHVDYENLRGPTRLAVVTRFGPTAGIGESRVDQDRVGWGFGLERPIWWSLLLLAGFENSFTLEDESRRIEYTDGTIDETKTVDESLDQVFAWGLRRSFDNLELAGSMSTDLDLIDLFFELDIGLRF